jgi:hypothetical protein
MGPTIVLRPSLSGLLESKEQMTGSGFSDGGMAEGCKRGSAQNNLDHDLDEHIASCMGARANSGPGTRISMCPAGQLPAGQQHAAARWQVRYTTAAQHAVWSTEESLN